jgi:hypothetical protein
MTKTEMMAALDDVLTDPRLSASLVRQLAATGADPRPLFDEFLCLASGGSSGRRGHFVHDIDGGGVARRSWTAPLVGR